MGMGQQIIVQKYGGTSVATTEAIQHVAEGRGSEAPGSCRGGRRLGHGAYDRSAAGNGGGPGDSIDLFISSQEIPDPAVFCRDLRQRFRDAVRVSERLGAVTLVGFGLGSRPWACLETLQILESRGVAVTGSFTTFIIPVPQVDECTRAMHLAFIGAAAPPADENKELNATLAKGRLQ
jgi:aspartokinase